MDAIILLYSVLVRDYSSYIDQSYLIDGFIKSIKEGISDRKVITYLVGNKVDLIEEYFDRCSKSTMETLGRDENFRYFEISAANPDDVFYC